MQVKILYFATFRSITGLREEVLSLSDRATLQDLKGCLVEIHPPIESSLPSAVFAINREFAFPQDELHDGDEVAIFPPVSGGSRSGKKKITKMIIGIDPECRIYMGQGS